MLLYLQYFFQNARTQKTNHYYIIIITNNRLQHPFNAITSQVNGEYSLKYNNKLGRQKQKAQSRPELCNTSLDKREDITFHSAN